MQPKKRRKYDFDLPYQWKGQTLRLPNHNYAGSASYFITICANVFDPIFETPKLRTILAETWEALPTRFPSITQDEFVIMPDHVHFIIHLEGNVKKPTSLPSVIGAYKSLTTVAWLRHIKATKLECPGIIWQDDYWERVIRDAEELEDTRLYIRNNPTRPG